MSRLDLIEAGLLVAGLNYTRTGKTIISQCPHHDDDKHSFLASEREDGRIVMRCAAGCDRDDLMASMGLYVRQPKFEVMAPIPSKRLGRDLRGTDGLDFALGEHDREAGHRVQGRDLDRYRECLRKLYSARGAA